MAEENGTLGRLSEKMDGIASDVQELKSQISSLSSSLERLARIEERHNNHSAALERAFNNIKEMDDRVKSIEVQEPITKLVRGWVIGGVIGVVSMVAISSGTLMFVTSRQPAPTQIIFDPDVANKIPKK